MLSQLILFSSLDCELFLSFYSLKKEGAWFGVAEWLTFVVLLLACLVLGLVTSPWFENLFEKSVDVDTEPYWVVVAGSIYDDRGLLVKLEELLKTVFRCSID